MAVEAECGARPSSFVRTAKEAGGGIVPREFVHPNRIGCALVVVAGAAGPWALRPGRRGEADSVLGSVFDPAVAGGAGGRSRVSRPVPAGGIVSAPVRQYVSFELAGGLYGLDIRIVKEVNANTDVTRVPLSPKHIRGLVNIRGQVVLVIDIAVLFGHEPLTITGQSQIVVLKTVQEIARLRYADDDLAFDGLGDKPVGCLVDRVGDVVQVNAADLSPPPPHIPETIARHVEAVVRLDDRLLVVLQPAEML